MTDRPTEPYCGLGASRPPYPEDEPTWEPAYEGEPPPGRCPEHYPDDDYCPDEGRVGEPRTTSPWVRRALHGDLPAKRYHV